MSFVRLLMVAVLSLSVTAQYSRAAASVNWTAQGWSTTFDQLFETSGALSTSGSYAIQMVVDIGNDSDIAAIIADPTSGLAIGGDTASEMTTFGGVNAGANVGDDVYGTWNAGLWTFSDFGAPYVGMSVDPAISSAIDVGYSSSFYFRWFNASTIGAATEVGYIYTTDNSWITPPDLGTASSAFFAYNSVGIPGERDANVAGSENGTGWQTMAAVPEPGSMGLLALGLVTLVARKRKRA